MAYLRGRKRFAQAGHRGPQGDRMLTIKDVAAFLRCSERQAYRVVALPGFPRAVLVFGTQKRWVRAEVEAWVTSQARRAA